MPRLTPPRDASKVTFVSMGTTRRPADEAGVDGAAPRARRLLLGRLSVGAKLMLLVLLPVGVLLGFTIAESADNWQTALSLRDFQNATEQSFAARLFNFGLQPMTLVQSGRDVRLEQLLR